MGERSYVFKQLEISKDSQIGAEEADVISEDYFSGKMSQICQKLHRVGTCCRKILGYS